MGQTDSDTQDLRPAIVIVDDDDRSRDRLERVLSSRYGRDYRVSADDSVATAVARLRSLHEAGHAVVLIVADLWMQEETGAAFLAGTRDLHPTAQRILVVDWADFTANELVVRASVLGEVDFVAFHPLTATDEAFHTIVTEALARWAREHGRSGEAVRLVGDPWDARTQVLRDAFQRWEIPFGVHDVASEAGVALLLEAGVSGPLPIVLLANGRVLVDPTPSEIAGALGATTTPVERVFDVVVLGAGPAGLAAAVYGTSEGLSVLVVEPFSLGGQASSSPMLRNYLGFPSGVSGSELTARAYQQAWTFGADFLIGRTATTIRADGDERVIALDDGTDVRARAVVIATGVAYRRMGVESVDAFIGRGVFYGSGTSEARALAGEPVFVVGGANSAAEAAIHLARYAERVTIVVRGSSIADGMSDYLVQSIEAFVNIVVRLNTEIAEAHGDRRLRSVLLRDRATGATEEAAATAVFVLIGAAPRTDWLPAEIERDDKGFVLTGDDRPAGAAGAPDDWTLATTMPGVFAAGDVRRSPVKRIAAAVGEGSTVIRQIHEYRRAQNAPAPEAGGNARGA